MRSFFNNIIAVIILLMLTTALGLIGFIIGLIIWFINASLLGMSIRKKEHKALIKAIQDAR